MGMNMRFASLPVLCFGLINVGDCNPNAIHGSGVSKTEVRTVGSFLKVELAGSPDVDVKIGPATSVVVTTDDNILPEIATTVEGGVLRIDSKESYNTHLGVSVKITAPTLEGVTVTGSGDIHVAGLKAQEISAHVTGSGEVTLLGDAEHFRGEVTGSGDLRADDLAARDVRVKVTGSGNASVRAAERLDASVTGSGSVRYSGRPSTVVKSVTGSGDIDSR
jgi:hypothetical protein